MKVPTMDQLRIRHEMAMAGSHAEWEELWAQVRVYGRAHWMVVPVGTDTYGRGDTALSIAARTKPMIATCYERWCRRVDWDYSLALEDFPRSATADAVQQHSRREGFVYGSVYGGDVQLQDSHDIHD